MMGEFMFSGAFKILEMIRTSRTKMRAKEMPRKPKWKFFLFFMFDQC